jgi:acetolactate decarboxylase
MRLEMDSTRWPHAFKVTKNNTRTNGSVEKEMKRCVHGIAFVILAVSTVMGCAGCSHVQKNDVVFQSSTINALLKGMYDGDVSFGELKSNGDFGIGTFNSLDGEMIGLEGAFYQIKDDGAACPVEDSMKTPFAVVTFFTPDNTILLDTTDNYEQLKTYLDGLLPSQNIFYAIKIEGKFKYIKTRSVPGQKKPYPPLVEVVKAQSIFEFQDIEGAIVGFRSPDYVQGINVPGYHLHFITRDRKAGGHLLECRIQDVRVEIDNINNFFIALPHGGEFYSADLAQDQKKDLEIVEKGTPRTDVEKLPMHGHP